MYINKIIITAIAGLSLVTIIVSVIFINNFFVSLNGMTKAISQLEKTTKESLDRFEKNAIKIIEKIQAPEIDIPKISIPNLHKDNK